MRIGPVEITPLSAMLVFIPICVVLEVMHADPAWIFITAGLGIIPLAGLMGTATEHLAEPHREEPDGGQGEADQLRGPRQRRPPRPRHGDHDQRHDDVQPIADHHDGAVSVADQPVGQACGDRREDRAESNEESN